MMNFDDLFNDVSGTDFEEVPVGIEEFVTSPDYLNMGETPLSPYQYELIRVSSQIYKEDTLIARYGEEEGRRKYRAETKNEIIACLGKGSGKDFISTIACSYIVYLLLCLKDPAKYYGRPSGDNIDIVNIAVNAAQANRVFFANFKKRIGNSPWFEGKYDAGRAGEVHFDKNISAYSGHSEREAFEGLNVIFVVLDEISAFAMNNTSGNESAKTAKGTYDMWRSSLTSRFSAEGKLVLLSFPRHKHDFIMTRYNEVVAAKQVVKRTHKFKLDPDLPDGVPDNEFSIEWDEDHIESYAFPKVWALKRPSWEVNPTKAIEEYMRDFYENHDVAIARFAAMPMDSEGGVFRDPKKVDESFSGVNMIVPTTGIWLPGFKPDPKKVYYVHADLAQKVDRAAVAIAHVDRWTSRKIGNDITAPAPEVVVDAVRYWTPTKERIIDLAEVREFILSLTNMGFSLGLVTVDRWAGGVDVLQYLKSRGIRTDVLSVGNEEYMHLAGAVDENRIKGPDDSILKSELLQLRIFPNGKIDHPRSGGKDLADSVAGAVYNAASLTKQSADQQIEIRSLSDFTRSDTQTIPPSGVIRNPDAAPMDENMREFLSGLRLL